MPNTPKKFDYYVRTCAKCGEYFKTKEVAIISRLKAELKYFGKEFAPQRHLFEEYGIL